MAIAATHSPLKDFSVRNFFEKILRDDILTQSAALGFYTALATSPLLVLLVTALSSLNFRWHEQLIEQAQGLLGDDAAKVIEAVLSHSSSTANVWSLLFFLISSSAVFAQLQTSLNLVFSSPKKDRGPITVWQGVKIFVTRRLICFGMVLTFVAVSMFSLSISAVMHLFSTGELKLWMQIAHDLGDFVIYILLFAVLFKWMPDCKVRWPAALRGGLLTSILFLIGKVMIGLYLSKVAVGSTYGAMGSFIVLLVFVYYSALIFMFGAEISSVL